MTLEDVTAAAIELFTLRAAVVPQRCDAAIRQAFADGVPIGAIAHVANITRADVGSILGHQFERVGRPARTASSPL